MHRLALFVALSSSAVAMAAETPLHRLQSEFAMQRAFDQRPPGARTAVSSATARPHPSPGGRLLWEDRYDGSPFEQVFSSTVLRGKVYSAGYVNEDTGRDFLVRVVDERTGALVWQDQVDTGDDEFASGVVTDGQRVFVSGDAFHTDTNYDWVLRAYDPDTGERLWETSFDLAGRSDFCRGTAIATGGGLVFLGGYGTNLQDQGDFNTDWLVRAYDAATGVLAWEDRTEAFSGAYSLTFEDGQLFVGGWTQANGGQVPLVRALEARTGRRLWERTTEVGSSTLLGSWTKVVKAHGGRVFAGQAIVGGQLAFAPRVEAFDARTGHRYWSRLIDTGPQDWLDDIDVAGSRVTTVGYGGSQCTFAVDSNCDVVVRTYGAAHGNLLWQRRLDLTGFDDLGNLVTAGAGVVFVNSAGGPLTNLVGCCSIGQWTVSAFDLGTGAPLWQSLGETGESGVYNMVLDHDRLIIPGRAVDASTGEWDSIVRAYDARGRGAVEYPVRRQVSGTGDAGQATYRLDLEGPVATAAHGLVLPKEHQGVLPDDPSNDLWTSLATHIGTLRIPFAVAPGTRVLRAALFNEATDGPHDLDLYLFRSGVGLVASSAGGDSNEGFTLIAPPAGNYTLVVHAYETHGPEAHFTAFAWTVGDATAGNLEVSPPFSTPYGRSVRVSWSDLSPGRYLGAVSYRGQSGEIAQTVVSVRVPE